MSSKLPPGRMSFPNGWSSFASNVMTPIVRRSFGLRSPQVWDCAIRATRRPTSVQHSTAPASQVTSHVRRKTIRRPCFRVFIITPTISFVQPSCTNQPQTGRIVFNSVKKWTDV